MVSAGLADAVLRGLVTGSIIAAGALSLSLVYSIAEVPNFAHGDMITVGAYVALVFNHPSQVPFVPAFGGVGLVPGAVVALALAGALGALYELVVFRRFRHRGADLVKMVIVTLGLALILRHVVLFLVGSKNVTYATPGVRTTNVDLFASTAGLTVELTRRGADGLVVLDRWGYAWPVALGLVAVSLAAGYGAYRWRRGDGEFEAVGLVSPRVLAAATGVAVLVAASTIARGGGFTITGAPWSTRLAVTPKVLVIPGTIVIAMFVMNVLLKRTRTGTAMRATADNMDLAQVRGVDVDRVQLVVWVLAGTLTALAGVLMGWFANTLTPNMGFTLLLPVFAAVILGGITSPYGAVLGSLVIGLSMEVGIHLVPADYATYRIAFAFVVLVAVLLVKPDGLWGDV